MTTDTTEKGLEALLVARMTASGWIAGSPSDYDRAYAVDLVQLHSLRPKTRLKCTMTCAKPPESVTIRA